MASIHRLPVSQMPTAHAEKKRAQDRINQRYSRARRKSKVEELEVKNKALLQRLVQAEAEIARLRDSQAVAAQRPLLMEKADPHAPQHYLQDTSEHLASKPSNAPRVETSRSGTGGLENESNLPTALTLRSEAVFALVEPNSLESELLRLHASSCAASQVVVPIVECLTT